MGAGGGGKRRLGLGVGSRCGDLGPWWLCYHVLPSVVWGGVAVT